MSNCPVSTSTAAQRKRNTHILTGNIHPTHTSAPVQRPTPKQDTARRERKTQPTKTTGNGTHGDRQTVTNEPLFRWHNWSQRMCAGEATREDKCTTVQKHSVWVCVNRDTVSCCCRWCGCSVFFLAYPSSFGSSFHLFVVPVVVVSVLLLSVHPSFCCAFVPGPLCLPPSFLLYPCFCGWIAALE